MSRYSPDHIDKIGVVIDNVAFIALGCESNEYDGDNEYGGYSEYDGDNQHDRDKFKNFHSSQTNDIIVNF